MENNMLRRGEKGGVFSVDIYAHEPHERKMRWGQIKEGTTEGRVKRKVLLLLSPQSSGAAARSQTLPA